ncbi:hypothetical protein [Clostridium sp. FP1]|nr:hypothetical protein [Clostridium sp. FP1]
MKGTYFYKYWDRYYDKDKTSLVIYISFIAASKMMDSSAGDD